MNSERTTEENDLTSEDIQITDTEKRILLLLSKSEFKIKEISFIFNRNASTIRSHLQTLREKGLVIDRNNLCPSTDKYYSISPKKKNKNYTLTEKAQSILSEERY